MFSENLRGHCFHRSTSFSFLVAYKRPQNIRDKLIRSKVPPPPSRIPKRKTPGMKKCNKCGVCPYIKEGKSIKATSTDYRVDVNSSVDCTSKNVIYLLGCNKCPQQYIGETERMLKDRFSEHKGCVNSGREHFNQKGHSVSVRGDHNSIKSIQPGPPI